MNSSFCICSLVLARSFVVVKCCAVYNLPIVYQSNQNVPFERKKINMEISKAIAREL